MVRLNELHETEAEHLRARALAMPSMSVEQWIVPRPLAESTVAIVSTAGLHRRDDPPFTFGEVDYRLVPDDVDFADLIQSHISVNFDRSAFQQDPNIMFPLDRLRELEAEETIGGISRYHYSFMGAMPDPTRFEAAGSQVGELLAADGVDVALLIPV